MSNNSTTPGNWSAEPPRTRRARTEQMTIALRRTGGHYDVRVASGRLYTVDVSIPACTCPDWQARQPAGGCKHLRRVDMEIKARTVPGPNGRLPNVELSERDDGVTEEPLSPLITGPHTEHDSRSDATGDVYYRCSRCGQEAMHREEVHEAGVSSCL